MPPKRRKKKQTMTRQRQSQRQSVVVNIGKTTKTRSKSGRGGLPPPSYQHNLTPVVLPQTPVDYSPLILAMMQQPTKSSLQQTTPPVNNLQPTASQMAYDAAIRRAGQTADGLQNTTSQSDERYAKGVQDGDDVTDREEFESKKRARSESNVSGGGDIPFADAQPVYEQGEGGGGTPIAQPVYEQGELIAESRFSRQAEDLQATEIQQATGQPGSAKKKPGRKLGSKNKPKPVEQGTQTGAERIIKIKSV